MQVYAASPHRNEIQRRTSHNSSDRTALTINIVVIGNMNLNPGRSMTTSPGRWNKGTLLSHGQHRPATTIKVPSTMRSRFIDLFCRGHSAHQGIN